MSEKMTELSGPVLIVGAGPVGMAAALELRQWGVEVTIIDALDTPRTTSRAGGIQPRTYELLDRYGMSEVLKAGREKLDGFTVFYKGELVGRIQTHLARSRHAQAPGVPQAEFEQVYRDFLAAAGVQVLWEHELVALSETDDGVLAEIRTPGGPLAFKAGWVIGCDGARSAVRKLLGLEFTGVSYPEAFGLMDAALDWELPPTTLRVFKDDGPQQIVIVPFSKTVYRLQIDHRDPAVADAPPTVAEMQEVLERVTGRRGRISNVIWASAYRIHRRQVEHYRRGRVFLAGDAAHIHAPAGAQGLNTGVQDAINLGWKLALVARGEAAAELLDTYEPERWPVAQAVLQLADTLVRNPSALVANAEVPPQVLADTHAQLLVNYRDGPLGGRREAEAAPAAGDRLPDVQVNGESVYHGLRGAKVVVALFGAEPDIAAAADRLARFGETLTIWKHAPGDALAQALGISSGAAVVRPDAFLGLVAGGSLPEAVGEVVEWLQSALRLASKR